MTTGNATNGTKIYQTCAYNKSQSVPLSQVQLSAWLGTSSAKGYNNNNKRTEYPMVIRSDTQLNMTTSAVRTNKRNRASSSIHPTCTMLLQPFHSASLEGTIRRKNRQCTLFVITLLSILSQTMSTTLTEQEILLALYDSTNGDNWKNKNNWKSDSVGICEWYGIVCDPMAQQQSNVIEIDLSHNNLNGIVPSSLWKLPHLHQVTLRNNLITSLSLQGLLTTDPTNDPRSPLETLIVSDNHLTTLNGIGNAAMTLKQINANKNQIDRALLDELSYCINLEIIYVAFNRIPGTIPTTIGLLTKLTEFYGFDNRLSGTIPTELGLLTSLQVLGLGNNLILGTLPTEMEQMVNLKDVSMHHIRNDPTGDDTASSSSPRGLSGPLLTFGDMPYLALLFLDGNSFTGSIPQDFLRHNTFTETSISVGLTYNQLTGTIPKSLERFEALTIDLAGNEITEIPIELCHKGGWMGGLVEQFQCDAILCAPGTYNELGRAFDSQHPCIPCDLSNSTTSPSTKRMGATTCDGLPGSSQSDGDSSQEPVAILANFHMAMAGQKWTIRDGWTAFDPLIDGTSTLDELLQSNITMCDGWYGILCDSDDQITDISLGNNELYGVVPDYIFAIPTLRSFDISNNNVQMPKLKGASQARELTSLILSNVKVQSVEGIGTMTNLRQLLLDGLEIKTPLSKELFQLTNLLTLHLQHGQFTGIMPSEIGRLTNLQDLNIYGNNLRGQIPLEIGSLTRLRSMDLSENQFTGTIPSQISSLVDLEIFAIHQREGVSNIGGPLPAFDDFPRLKEVNLEYNALTGSIPHNFLARIADKSNEISISLGFNQIQGAIPGALNAFDKLILNLEGNRITSIPSPLCSKSNWMQGEVGKIANTTEKCNAILCPPGFWNEYGKESEGAPCLACENDSSSSQGSEWEFWYGRVSCGDITPSREKEILDIFFSATGGRYWKEPHGNWLRPGVPICQREGVECGNRHANTGVLELRMNGFGLRGTIPSEIWELTSARQLAFTRNEVELSFEGIEKAVSLVVLKLSSCHVRTLDGLGKVSNKLRELHLAGNQFSGTIPAEMFELDQVQLLFLNGNNFSGKIPTQLAKLTSLTRLELFDNGFTGPLPTEIGLLTDLTVMELQFNALSGTIPTELQTLQKLARLDISYQNGRKFEGAFPAFDRSPALTYIDATGNRFSGTLPANLLAMIDSSQQVNVFLKGNSLEGAVPSEWSRFESLNVELGGNRLTALPESLCQMNNWQKGLVGLFQTCDAILCPPGTQAPTGRQNDATELCSPCSAGATSAPYYGTLACLDPRLVAEKRILSDFYDNTNGTNWLIQTNWLSDEPVCSWFGIFCDPNNHVKEIKLYTNMIIGSPANKDIISSILTLSELTLLDLKGNSLELNFAKFPDTTRLEYLGLSGTGMKSIVGISRAKSLKALYATNNEIRSIPEEVFSMTNLESLFLSYNSITGTLSTHLARMSSLKDLYMFGNRLTGTIPSEIGTLPNLRDIMLARNYLSGTLPDSLSFMPNLKQLLVYDQQGPESLSGPLPSLSGSPKLWNFDASDNQLKGPVPDNFMMSSSSTGSSISVNLRNNDITGTLPLELKRFGMLDINLADNKILNIPSELCSLGGWMQGKVELVGNCSAILCPKGFFNQFGHESPGIPCLPCDHLINDPYLGHTQCENFTSERDTLNKIYVNTGGEFWTNSTNWKSETPICSWHGVSCENGNPQDAEGITSLRLDNNGLSGTLPSEVWTLPALRYLSLQNNPNLVINFNGLSRAAATLEVLSLSETGLRSMKGISAASSLKELHVTGNRIKGTFPDELFALSQSLESLHITDNLFYGSLPTKLGKLTKLQELHAFQNDFLSTIPSELGRLEYLRVLVLAENLLYGQIPDELSDMPSLEMLDLFRREKSGPRLTGSLPSFNKLPQLKEFYLQGNSIQGSIPDNFLGSSRSLQVARLGLNMLTGKVPDILGVLTSLSLQLEGNLITGLPEIYCQNKGWMDGAVGVFGCNAILCPPGTANPLGRVNADAVECTECPKASAPTFFGSTSCFGPWNEREILLKLFASLDGKGWYRNDFWGSKADICDWYGIGCIGGHVAVINLSANNLRGLPAPEIFLLPELRVLWLYSNPMEFSFANIMSAKKLEDLRLDSTMVHSLRGVGSATSLVSLDAGFTGLRGSLPEHEILSLTNLRTLMLNNNDFTGTLPKSFASLKYLVTLRLDSNRLSGKLPSFDDMPFLEYVDVSDNQLEGPIPRNFFQILDIQASPTLRLMRNQLTGVIPQEFDRFDDMSIYLAGNQILGLPVVLCDNANWNDGEVGDYGCDAILCKPGSSNAYGRRTRDSQCQPCFSASYYGDISCPGDRSSATRTQLSLLAIAALVAVIYKGL